MRVNSTVALTFVLLTLMLGAGVVSASWGFAIGREALRGIQQPDSRPTNKVNRQPTSAREELVLLKEENILKTVKERIGGAGRSSSQKSDSSSAPQSKTEPISAERNAEGIAAKLPISSQDKGVTMEVTSIRKQGDFVMLDVAMRNNGAQPVKFLYSFLNVTDEKGRVISADTTGLPSDLPSKSDRYTGTVSISSALLDRAKKVSLQLTDYPEQKLQLKMADIPIKER